MIGSFHPDPEGADALMGKLEELSPDIILLEGCPSIPVGMAEQMERLRSTFGKKKVPNALAKVLLDVQRVAGFEYRIAESFGKRHRIAVDYLGDKEFDTPTEALKQEALRNAKALKAGGVTAKTLRANQVNNVATMLKVFRDVLPPVFGTDKELQATTLPVPGQQPPPMGPRDNIMAAKLRETAESHPDAKIVTVTGLRHVLRDSLKRTFFSKVGDLSPERSFLIDGLSGD